MVWEVLSDSLALSSDVPKAQDCGTDVRGKVNRISFCVPCGR